MFWRTLKGKDSVWKNYKDLKIREYSDWGVFKVLPYFTCSSCQLYEEVKPSLIVHVFLLYTCTHLVRQEFQDLHCKGSCCALVCLLIRIVYARGQLRCLHKLRDEHQVNGGVSAEKYAANV